MKRWITMILFLLGLSKVALADPVSQLRSVYSDLSGPNCRLVSEDRETGATTFRCKGVSGYDLLVLEDDLRMSVTVLTPDQKEYPLDFWSVITPGFSSLGKKAEWRVINKGNLAIPLGLIVPVNASEVVDSHENRKKISYLAIVKILPNEICVTEKVHAKKGNRSTKERIDSAIQKACLKKTEI